MIKKLHRPIIIAVTVLLFLFLPAIFELYVDIVWYKSVGFVTIKKNQYKNRVFSPTFYINPVLKILMTNFRLYSNL